MERGKTPRGKETRRSSGALPSSEKSDKVRGRSKDLSINSHVRSKTLTRPLGGPRGRPPSPGTALKKKNRWDNYSNVNEPSTPGSVGNPRTPRSVGSPGTPRSVDTPTTPTSTGKSTGKSHQRRNTLDGTVSAKAQEEPTKTRAVSNIVNPVFIRPTKSDPSKTLNHIKVVNEALQHLPNISTLQDLAGLEKARVQYRVKMIELMSTTQSDIGELKADVDKFVNDKIAIRNLKSEDLRNFEEITVKGFNRIDERIKKLSKAIDGSNLYLSSSVVLIDDIVANFPDMQKIIDLKEQIERSDFMKTIVKTTQTRAELEQRIQQLTQEINAKTSEEAQLGQDLLSATNHIDTLKSQHKEAKNQIKDLKDLNNKGSATTEALIQQIQTQINTQTPIIERLRQRRLALVRDIERYKSELEQLLLSNQAAVEQLQLARQQFSDILGRLHRQTMQNSQLMYRYKSIEERNVQLSKEVIDLETRRQELAQLVMRETSILTEKEKEVEERETRVLTEAESRVGRIREIQSQISTLDSNYGTDYERLLNEKLAEKQQFLREIAESNRELIQLHARVNSRKQELKQLQREVATLESSISSQSEVASWLKTKYEEVVERYRQMHRAIPQWTLLGDLHQQLLALKTRIEEKQRQVVQGETLYKFLEARLKTIQSKIQEGSQSIRESQSELESIVREASGKEVELKQRKAQLDNMINKIQQDLSAKQRMEESLQSQIREIEARIAQKEQRLRELPSLQQIEKEISDEEKQIQDIDAEINNNENRKNRLQKLQDSLKNGENLQDQLTSLGVKGKTINEQLIEITRLKIELSNANLKLLEKKRGPNNALAQRRANQELELLREEHKLQNEHDSFMNDVIRPLKVRLRQAEEKRIKLEEQIRKSEASLGPLQKRLAELQTQLSDVSSNVASMEESLKVSTEKLESVTAEDARAKQQLSESSSSLEQTKQSLSAKKQEVSALFDAFQTLNKEVDVDKINSTIASLQSKATELKETLMGEQAKVDGLKADIANLLRQVDVLKPKHERLSTQVATLQENIKQKRLAVWENLVAMVKLERDSVEYDKLFTGLQNKSAKLTELLKDLDAKRQSFDQVNMEFNLISKELEARNDQIKSLKTSRRQKMVEIATLNAKRTAAEKEFSEFQAFHNEHMDRELEKVEQLGKEQSKVEKLLAELQKSINEKKSEYDKTLEAKQQALKADYEAQLQKAQNNHDTQVTGLAGRLKSTFEAESQRLTNIHDSELDELKKRLESTLEAESQRLTHDHESRLQELRMEHAQKMKDLEDTAQRLVKDEADAIARNEEQQRQIQNASEALGILEKDVASLEQKKLQSSLLLQTLQSEVSTSDAEFERIRNDLRQDIARKESEISEKQKLYERSELELSVLTKTHKRLEDNLVNLRNKVGQTLSEIEELKRFLHNKLAAKFFYKLRGKTLESAAERIKSEFEVKKEIAVASVKKIARELNDTLAQEAKSQRSSRRAFVNVKRTNQHIIDLKDKVQKQQEQKKSLEEKRQEQDEQIKILLAQIQENQILIEESRKNNQKIPQEMLVKNAALVTKLERLNERLGALFRAKLDKLVRWKEEKDPVVSYTLHIAYTLLLTGSFTGWFLRK